MKTVFDVSADKLNNTSSRESDSSWKYIDELTSLNNKVNDVKSALELLETRLTTNLDSQYQKLDKRSQILTEEIETKLNSQIKESK
jgi:CII-binding regulator of phage lambda lysogenization HflD